MRKKIRICYIIDTFYGVYGGTERQLVQLINRLNGERFEIHLLCLYASACSPTLGGIVRNCHARTLRYKGMCRVGTAAVVKEMIGYLRENKVEIVQTFLADSIYMGTIAAKLAGVPVTITSRRSMGYWYRRRDVLLLRIFNRWATNVCVNSSAVGDMVIGWEKCPREKISVIYNGIEVQTFLRERGHGEELRKSLGIGEGERVIGMIANLRPVKGVEMFLEGLLKLKAERYKFKAVIVGGEDARYGREIREYSKALGIADGVVFAGKQDDVVPYLRLFDVGVLTSYSEGFSNAILEYMAAGLPVVATAAGGNGEVIDSRHGYLVPVGDSEMLATRLGHLLSDEKARMAMGKASLQKVVTTYSWERVIDIWEAYYGKLIRQHCGEVRN